MTEETRLSTLIQTDSIKKRFEEVLADSAPQFMSSLLVLSNGNEALKKCDPMSQIVAAMKAATLDMSLEPSLGQAYIVPYGGVATFQLGWKGYVQLALRTGQYRVINATEVYEGQLKSRNSFTGEFEFQEERISDKVIGYVSYFKLNNGFEHWLFMSREEMEKHAKRYSKMYQAGKGRWMEDFDGQGRKTVTKLNLSKFGPLSVQMQKALKEDDSIDVEGETAYPDNPTPELPPAAQTTPTTATPRLAKLVGTPAQAPVATPEQQTEMPGVSPI